MKSRKGDLGRREFLKGAVLAAAPGLAKPQPAEVQMVEHPGSHYMLDVFQSLGIEYMFASPGSMFCGGRYGPELIVCSEADFGIAMAHGYANVAGKPALVCVRDAPEDQLAEMAVYKAYYDQTPAILLLESPSARLHGLVKWEDRPASLRDFGESGARAYQLAMTPPMMPVILVADAELLTHPIPRNADLRVPKHIFPSAPAVDPSAVAQIAKLLVAAENPVIVTSRSARTPAGLQLLVELAELLQCGVIDRRCRMNFPSLHPLNVSWRVRAAVRNADALLGLETYNLSSAVQPLSFMKSGPRLISISSTDLFYRSNYQNFQSFDKWDFSVAADAEATLPALIEAVRREMTPGRRRAAQDRGARIAEMSRQAREQNRRDAAAADCDSGPISAARLSAELWGQIQHEDWSLVSDPSPVSEWPLRLWDFDRPHQYIGGGYKAGAGALGAALANRKHGRLSVSILSGGELLYRPDVLSTAADHHIPLLILVCNDQIDSASIAQSMGVQAEGPVTNPARLAPAIRCGIETVKGGEPYLIGVAMAPRGVGGNAATGKQTVRL